MESKCLVLTQPLSCTPSWLSLYQLNLYISNYISHNLSSHSSSRILQSFSDVNILLANPGSKKWEEKRQLNIYSVPIIHQVLGQVIHLIISPAKEHFTIKKWGNQASKTNCLILSTNNKLQHQKPNSCFWPNLFSRYLRISKWVRVFVCLPL